MPRGSAATARPKCSRTRQVSAFATHVHSVAINTGTESADHIHGMNFTSQGMNASNPHSHVQQGNTLYFGGGVGIPGGGAFSIGPVPGSVTNTTDINHGHQIIGSTAGISNTHFHAVNGNTAATGDTETRPISASAFVGARSPLGRL
ncbi:hypothetical protein [Bradyrhizobium sp. Ai1a-2]|uniref:hypothetical protein n=1 Tax=Bradyrhizobium sp. Ai1a-2 TaxID=196490 RepID=UPI0012684448|nr:hypothetical protein [Bradyrhizobium sp. Ai1a-2]